jgi:predicted DNA-binding transcriptional regulator AlpA
VPTAASVTAPHSICSSPKVLRLRAAHELPDCRISPVISTKGLKMAVFTPNPSQGFLRTPEAARFLGLSPRTLEKHRVYGTGPQYFKLGGRVVYKLNDLQTWADRGVRRSTSDPGIGKVLPAKPSAGMPRNIPISSSQHK